MNNLFSRLSLAALLAFSPMVAAAQSVQDSIIAQLQAQGFTQIEVSRTLLGRVRVKATSATLERELVFNPNTGEILRDYWENRSDNANSAPVVLNPNHTDRDHSGGAGSSGSGSEPSTDDGKSGSSGSGGSNSGSGSGSGGGSSGSGSGSGGDDGSDGSGDDSGGHGDDQNDDHEIDDGL
jgi:hypothetical protein